MPDSPLNSRRANKRVQQEPADALELLGLRAWSRAMDVSPETALAAAATVLTGMAGPDPWLEATWGPVPLPKLDLLSCRRDGPVQRLIDCLAAPVLQLNRRLSQKMGVHSPEALELCTTGTTSNKHAPPALVERTMRNHWQALTLTSGDGSLLDQDLAFDPVPNRMEAITHPEFLLENPRGRDLTTLIDQCHLHTALVIRPVLALDRKGSEPHQMMSQLTALLEGTIVRKRGHSSCQTAKACAILALGDTEIECMQASGHELLDRLLWLVAGTAVDAPADAEASRRFFRSYQQAATVILDTRRQGRAPALRLQDDHAMAEFETELVKYRHELSQLPVNPGSSAQALPQSLLWTMGFLRLAVTSSQSDESLVQAAFFCARQLVETHVRELTRKDEANKVEARCDLAEQIVLRLTSKPVRLRALVRSFDDQRKARFMPVINALMELGVLVRDDESLYHVGSVELTEVIGELLAKLAVSQGSTEAEAGESAQSSEDAAPPRKEVAAEKGLKPVEV